MSKYENRMLMYVLALSDFKLLACLWAANARTFYTFFLFAPRREITRATSPRPEWTTNPSFKVMT